MSKKPVIGISTSVIIDNTKGFLGYEKVYVNKDYVDAVIQNGGIPLMIPFSEDEKVIESQVELVDAVILSGGHDVFPAHYNREPQPKLGDVFPERDKYDFKILECAKKRKIPILGICRGMQIINVYEGGTLYQDLSYIGRDVLKHVQGGKPYMRTHYIEIDTESILGKIFSENRFMVNSFHHQAIENIGKDLKVIANASDGIIEAVEHKNYPFLVGVQWHPEMLFKKYEPMNKLFERLINESKK